MKLDEIIRNAEEFAGRTPGLLRGMLASGLFLALVATNSGCNPSSKVEERRSGVEAVQMVPEVVDYKRLMGVGSLPPEIEDYLKNNLREDRDANISNLTEIKQRAEDTNLQSSYATGVVAKSGRISFAIYNINVSGKPPVHYSDAAIRYFLSQAFGGLGLSVSVNYVEVDLRDAATSNAKSPEDLTQRKQAAELLEETIGKSSLMMGEKEVFEGIIPYYLREILGVENTFVSNRTVIATYDLKSGTGKTITPPYADIVVIIADFLDSNAAGISFKGGTVTDTNYTFIDQRKGDLPFNATEIAFIEAHEAGHELGLNHSSYPLDIMSHSQKAARIILSNPRFAFGPESMEKWQQLSK